MHWCPGRPQWQALPGDSAPLLVWSEELGTCLHQAVRWARESSPGGGVSHWFLPLKTQKGTRDPRGAVVGSSKPRDPIRVPSLEGGCLEAELPPGLWTAMLVVAEGQGGSLHRGSEQVLTCQLQSWLEQGPVGLVSRLQGPRKGGVPAAFWGY